MVSARTLGPGLATVCVWLLTQAAGAQSHVNWESSHVHPLELTPDGSTLLAVNTSDDRLEVFEVDGSTLRGIASIPVGLDPVSVRARSNGEAWVVNHISDSISIIDLDAGTVVDTILTADEPADVLFVNGHAYVSISQLDEVHVYDVQDPDLAPEIIEIAGQDPRGLATDGQMIYVAIFESGNRTTVLDHTVVSSDVSPYPAAPNPPPNAGTEFSPPINPALPPPLPMPLIVRQDGPTGGWFDDNDGDWSAAVSWGLHDHDVAIIATPDHSVTYATDLMTTVMAIAARPDGSVSVVGTDARNELRFEPILNGTFLEVLGAVIDEPGPSGGSVVDLNPHLDYSTPTVDQATRDQSVGDPRGIDWSSDGAVGYIVGMGSANLVIVDEGLARVADVQVGDGPTGVVVNLDDTLVYTLNRFDSTISIVDAGELEEVDSVAFLDPMPAFVRAGRTFLYNTHVTSGLGHVSCGSCHIDGRLDHLAWDLGSPEGEMVDFQESSAICNFGFGGCEDWHPIKGALMTQTLVGALGTEPLHWRGDRADMPAFNAAFESLLGDDEQLDVFEMLEFMTYVSSLTHPPNPNRNLDNTLKDDLPNGGSAVNGEVLFLTEPFAGGFLQCVACHDVPTGTNGQLTSGAMLGQPMSIKIPQLRNLFDKTGFDATSMESDRGFGFAHDGTFPTIMDFLHAPLFSGFADGAKGDQQRLDLEAYILSFSTDTHAGVGAQVTVNDPEDLDRLDLLVSIADMGDVDMIVKGTVDGERRGYAYLGGGQYQSDRAAETVSGAELEAVGAMTWTLVPPGAASRMGIDRDEDGWFDRDELDFCASPATADSVPGNVAASCCSTVCSADPFCCDNGWDDSCIAAADELCGVPCPADVDGDGSVTVLDLIEVIVAFGVCPGAPIVCPADVTGNGEVDVEDLVLVITFWGTCPE
ncbi:MAG: beta-propeller fold lactonase family protein [Planctomycetota bacterium]